MLKAGSSLPASFRSTEVGQAGGTQNNGLQQSPPRYLQLTVYGAKWG